MKPLRVLTIGHSYVVALNRAVMARVARDPRIELTVAAPRFFHGDLRPLGLDDEPDAPYRLVGLPAHWTRRIHVFFYRELGRLITPGAFDLVHAWEEPYIVAGYQIARAARSSGTRYVFRTAQSLSKRYPPPFSHFERFCVRHASGWIAGGHLVQQNLLARGYPRTNAAIITLGVDEERFHPDPDAGAAMRARLGLVGPVIGFVGRLTAAKGLDVLMAALETTPGPWSLLALGSGPYETKIRDWAAARGLTDRVRVLLAKHDEVPAFLQAMDLLVAPSQTMSHWKEQFGRMIIEAFACKLPVIGSDSGEIPFVIADAGLVVPEADPTAWTEAIAGLLASPERRRALAEAGHDRCHQLYTASRVAQTWVDYYHQVVASLPGGPQPLTDWRPVLAGAPS